MKFQVFKNGDAVTNFELCGAYLFGPDSIPLRSGVSVTFKDGVVDCRKKSPDAAGLALLWPIEGFGKVLLPTTRLPDRTKPYILNLEIARAKLMQITIKREDWSLLESSTEHSKKLEEAKIAFIDALQHINDPAKASRLADESLQKAVMFSETLTSRYAELLFNARHKTRGISKQAIGCQMNPQYAGNPEYMDSLSGLVNFTTIPLNWRRIEPEKGKYDFAGIDSCIEALVKRKMGISAGPILRFTPEFLPEWLLSEKGGFGKIRETAYEFVNKIVTRYCKYVHIWRVISGLNALNHFDFSFEQILEMTRAATLAAKAANSKSVKMIEIAQPWGEYYATKGYSIPPLVYVDMVNQSGISFDAFGVEILLGKNESGMHVRDLMHISAMLDRFVPLTKPLHVTAVAVPDNCGKGDQDCNFAGIWRRQWDAPLQAQWVEQFIKIALSKPYIESVTYANFADNGVGHLEGSGLIGKDLKLKQSYHEIEKLQKLIVGK